MRFLANENFPGAAIKALVAGGHDVASVRSIAPGSADRDVLALAVREQRVLLTFDKDFGELALPDSLFPQRASILPCPLPKGFSQRMEI